MIEKERKAPGEKTGTLGSTWQPSTNSESQVPGRDKSKRGRGGLGLLTFPSNVSFESVLRGIMIDFLPTY